VTVQDISHVEVYTKDKISTVHHLVSALGFTRVADCVEADRSSVLLRQGGVQLVVTSGRGTWKFLSEYGEGIADAALICEDVAATRDAALAAGATVGRSRQDHPVVSGFGAMSHTLLPATADGTLALPPGRRWAATPGAPAEPDGRIRRLDHLAVRLPADRTERYAAFCERVFGFTRIAAERPGLAGGARESLTLASASEHVVFVLTPSGGPDALAGRGGGPGVQSLAFLDGLSFQLVERRGRLISH